MILPLPSGSGSYAKVTTSDQTTPGGFENEANGKFGGTTSITSCCKKSPTSILFPRGSFNDKVLLKDLRVRFDGVGFEGGKSGITGMTVFF